MIRPEELQELAAFRSEDTPILSAYLNVDPRRRTPEEYKLALRRLLDEVSDVASGDDVARIERYVNMEYNWQGRGLACFSCEDAGLWQAYSLGVPLEDYVYVGRRPYVRPLGDVVDTYARHVVVLVSREEARFFLFEQGEVHEFESLSGEDVKRHKQGGWSAARYQRHEDAAAYRNLRELADATSDFCRQQDCQRLILAGTEQTIAQFLPLLPRSLQEQVVGNFAADMTAPASKIAERAMEIAQQSADDEQAELVSAVITAARKGGAGALGLADTLRLLEEGRVRHVLLADGFEAPAYECSHCGYMTVEPMSECAFCGGDMRMLKDAVNALTTRALARGVAVTTIRDNEEFEEAGSIGAALRY